MVFIGVMTGKKQEAQVITELEKELKQKKQAYQVLPIKKENMDHLKHVAFDSILINEVPNEIKGKEISFGQLLEKTKVVFLNIDEEIQVPLLEKDGQTYITYGLNSKATITASSIDPEEMMVSVQREIPFEKNTIEMQDRKVKNVATKLDYSNKLGIIAVMLRYNEKEE